MERSTVRKLKEKAQKEYLYLNGHKPVSENGYISFSAEVDVEKELFFDSKKSFFMLRHTRFCSVEERRLMPVSLHYTCSGTLHHFVDKEAVQVPKGSFLLVKSGALHRIEKAGEQDIGIAFFLNKDFVNSVFMLPELLGGSASFLHEILLGTHAEYPCVCFHEKDNKQLKNLVENLILSFTETSPADSGIIRVTFGLMFQYMLRDFQQQYVREKKERDSRSMLEVIRYVEQNYRSASLQELGQEMGMSVAALSRFIKKHSELTFKELVLEKRLRLTEDYLIHTQLPINEISITVGYENSSHFYQLFQKRTGMTPKEFREKNRKKTNAEQENRIMMLNNKINHYWSERAESYSEQNNKQLETSSEKWKEALRPYLPEQKEARALDIGTGPGFLAVLLAQEGYGVSAVDRNIQMLHFARENAARAGVDISCFLVEDELPFPEESFDLIVSRDVVWMQLEPEKTLSAWYRLLKKGGRLVYMDAEWYGYLRDEQERKTYKEYRRFVKARSGFVYHRANEMEQLAYECPLTYEQRPQWDKSFWEKFKPARIICEEKLNPRIYTELEQLQYARNQEFLICVEKQAEAFAAGGKAFAKENEKWDI